MARLRKWWYTAADRLTILIAAVVLLFGSAVLVALIRFEDSRSADREALDESQTQFFAQQVRTDITDEGGIADAYAGDGNPADLADLSRVKKSLSQALGSLKKSPGLESSEAGIIAAVGAEQRQLESIFRDQLKPVAGTAEFDEGVHPYQAQVEKMESRIDAFNRRLAARAADAASHADSTASSAGTAAIIAALLAAALAIAIGIYVVRLVNRLLNRISTAAAVLAPMAREMEAAIAETATATSEESSAGAGAATTAEELAATPTSITDNAKAAPA